MDHCNGASASVLRVVISVERQEIIVNVERFVKLMTGHFDNKEQFTEMKEEGKIFPYAQHVNTVCNDKIKNIPEDFTGIFIVEESYYETDGRSHASPHLFLITQFTPVMVFRLWEKFSDACLEVSESMEVHGKRTFGYDVPIRYKRVASEG